MYVRELDLCHHSVHFFEKLNGCSITGLGVWVFRVDAKDDRDMPVFLEVRNENLFLLKYWFASVNARR